MTTLLTVLSLSIGLSVLVTVWVVIVRQDLFDRVIGIGIIGTKATVLLAIAGALFRRLDAFVDLALAYALLNFIFTLAVAKYLTRKGPA